MPPSDPRAAAVASFFAEFLTLPLDCLKTVQQTNPRASTYELFKLRLQTGGFTSLWRGGAAAIGRQVVSGTLVIAIYGKLRRSTLLSGDSFLMRLACAGAAGGLSICVVNPLEVLKTQQQAAGAAAKPYAELAGKLMARHGLRFAIYGLIPNVQRCILVNASELGVYDQVSSSLVTVVPSAHLRVLAASLVAGVMSVAISNPVDLAKTELMAHPELYRSMRACLAARFQLGGIKALYRGALLNWVRKAPYTMLFFMIYEALHVE